MKKSDGNVSLEPYPKTFMPLLPFPSPFANHKLSSSIDAAAAKDEDEEERKRSGDLRSLLLFFASLSCLFFRPLFSAAPSSTSADFAELGFCSQRASAPRFAVWRCGRLQ